MNKWNKVANWCIILGAWGLVIPFVLYATRPLFGLITVIPWYYLYPCTGLILMFLGIWIMIILAIIRSRHRDRIDLTSRIYRRISGLYY